MMYSYDEKKYVLETESNPVTINYTTGAGRGVITMDPARVFPCTVHDIKTIIDTLWMSADPYEIAEQIADYMRACVAEIQETRAKYSGPFDAKTRSQFTSMIKKYISNLDKIADAFGFESLTDCEVDNMKMTSCEALVMEPESPGSYKKVIKKYNAKQFTKAGITFKVYQTAKKGARYIQVPGFGRYVVSYHGAEKEAPAHITNEIIKLLCNPEKADQMRALHNEFLELCALCGVEPEAMPEAITAETHAENTPAPALDAEASEARPAEDQETRTAEKPARKEEKPARNVIKRDSAMIIGSWKQATTAGAPGDKFVIVKIDGSGLVGYNLRTLKTYSFFASNLRNADFFEIEAQYPGKPYDYETGYNMIDGWIERAKENRREAHAERAQVWKPCIMSPLRRYGIIYRDIMGATDRQEPASADRVKAVLRLPKMQGYINLGTTDKKPVTGAERSHKAKPAPGGYPPKRNGEKARNRQEAPQARPTPQVTVRGSPQNQGEKIIENAFFQTEIYVEIV